MKKCIVFDLDGTLLNTIEDLNCACNFALKNNGYNEITLDETKKYIGNGIKLLVERSLKGKLDNFTKVFDDFKKYYFDHCNVYTKKYYSIDRVLNYLISKKCFVGVLSNKNEIILRKLCMEQFGDLFDVVLGDSKNRNKKPCIDGLLEIAKLSNVDVEDIIYIGDSDVDVKTVRNAKCCGIFVSYGFRCKDDLIDAGAKIICDNCDELLSELKKYI